MNNKSLKYNKATVKVYHGYGHTHNLTVFGHVLKNKISIQRHYTKNIFVNIFNIIKLFFVTPLPDARVKLDWQGKSFYSTTELDGFFKFEWESENELMAGWHRVTVALINDNGDTIKTGDGKIFIPHSTQYGFISDIDDTVLISHSGTTGKKLWSMLTKNPHRRKTFSDVVNYYQLLSAAHTDVDVPNPFFYVSSSEWNLYNYLNEFFKFNSLPKGAFLLNDIKKWYQLLKSGGTKHHGKLIRVARILKAFPAQQFILLGDNSQMDPDIYKSIADKYPGRIFAIYIRNISPDKEAATTDLLASLEDKSIFTLLYKHTSEAILHSRSIGLIV